MTDERMGRCVIYLQAVGTALGYVLSVVLVDTFYVSRHVHDPGMAFGYSFCLVQGGIISSLLLLSVAIKYVRHTRERRWEKLRPSILEKASAHLSGNDSTADLLAIQKRHPVEVERSIVELLCCVQGATRARLSMLAADLGLIERWREQYRSMRLSKRREAIGWMGRLVHDEAIPVLLRALSDPDDEIKLEAARSLIRSSGEREIAEVFRTAVRESLLIRAVLTEALRAHAAMLCRNVLPGELASPTAKHVRTALEIVRAWGKMLPLPAPQPLLRHEDSGVRVAALAILPQYGDAAAFGPEIVRLLGDADERVRAAAAQTAGRLHLGSAAEALHTCLLGDGADAVVAAAYALAQIGETGWRMLEKEVLGPRRASAAAALEALEQLKSERLLLVAL